MPVHYGDRNLPLHGTVWDSTVTLYPVENDLTATPVTLPTSVPAAASAQVVYTLASNLFPTFSEAPLAYSTYPELIVCVKNVGGVSGTATCQAVLNGSNAGGTSTVTVPAGNIATFSVFRFAEAGVNATVGASVAFSIADAGQLVYHALVISPLGIKPPLEPGQGMLIELGTIDTAPSGLTGGVTPTRYSTMTCPVSIGGSTKQMSFSAGDASLTNCVLGLPSNGVLVAVPSMTTLNTTHATIYPRYYAQAFFPRMRIRGLPFTV